MILSRRPIAAIHNGPRLARETESVRLDSSRSAASGPGLDRQPPPRATLKGALMEFTIHTITKIG